MNPESVTQLVVPIIDLAGANVSVGPAPEKPSMRQLVIGPVMLRIVVDDDAKQAIIRGLTGIHLPDKPGQLQ